MDSSVLSPHMPRWTNMDLIGSNASSSNTVDLDILMSPWHASAGNAEHVIRVWCYVFTMGNLSSLPEHAQKIPMKDISFWECPCTESMSAICKNGGACIVRFYGSSDLPVVPTCVCKPGWAQKDCSMKAKEADLYGAPIMKHYLGPKVFRAIGLSFVFFVALVLTVGGALIWSNRKRKLNDSSFASNSSNGSIVLRRGSTSLFFQRQDSVASPGPLTASALHSTRYENPKAIFPAAAFRALKSHLVKEKCVSFKVGRSKGSHQRSSNQLEAYLDCVAEDISIHVPLADSELPPPSSPEDAEFWEMPQVVTIQEDSAFL